MKMLYVDGNADVELYEAGNLLAALQESREKWNHLGDLSKGEKETVRALNSAIKEMQNRVSVLLAEREERLANDSDYPRN